MILALQRVVSGVVLCGFSAASAWSQDVSVPAIPGSETPSVSIPVKRVKIDPRFVIGHTYRYVTNTNIRAQLPDRGIREMSLQQQARYTVSPRLDGKPGSIVNGRTEHLLVSLRSAGVALKYDSFEASDRKTKFGQFLQPGLREAIEVKINRDNRVVKSEQPVVLQGEPEAEESLPRFGPDELTELISLLLQGASRKSVGQGQTWNLQGSRVVESAGEVTFELRYQHMGTIDFEGHECEKIGVSGTLSGLLPAPASGERGVEAEMRFDGGSLGGELVYDPLLRAYRHLKQSISMLLEMPPSQPDSNPRQIAIEQTTSSRLLHRITTP